MFDLDGKSTATMVQDIEFGEDWETAIELQDIAIVERPTENYTCYSNY